MRKVQISRLRLSLLMALQELEKPESGGGDVP
jgi:hypothetical protein